MHHLQAIFPFIQLIRLHRPVGIFLLFWPCCFGLFISPAEGWNLVGLIIRFALGATLMRSAGCIINDIIDRKLDKHVERTKDRPLASGLLSVKQALLMLAALLLLSFFLLLTFNTLTIIIGLASIIPVAIYPLMKRITHLPQLFLGMTFNLGALMGYSAATGYLSPSAWFLYLGSITWTLGYDTIYACMDRSDDEATGIKSTARKYRHSLKHFLSYCYFTTLFFLILTGLFNHTLYYYWVGILLVAMSLAWQIFTLKPDNRSNCQLRFSSNAFTGAIIAFTILLGVP